MPTNADRCTVCNHSQADEINLLLERNDVSHTALSKRFGVTRFALIRHGQKHMVRGGRLRVVKSKPETAPPPPDPEPEAQAEPEPPPEPKTVEERKSIFIDVVAETGSQQKAQRVACVSWAELRQWHEDDEQFTFLLNIAIAHAKDALIDIARDRAIQGTKQVLQIYRRQALIEERVEYKPSDSALLALLKAFHPELFGDKLTVTQTTVVKAIDAVAWESV